MNTIDTMEMKGKTSTESCSEGDSHLLTRSYYNDVREPVDSYCSWMRRPKDDAECAALGDRKNTIWGRTQVLRYFDLKCMIYSISRKHSDGFRKRYAVLLSKHVEIDMFCRLRMSCCSARGDEGCQLQKSHNYSSSNSFCRYHNIPIDRMDGTDQFPSLITSTNASAVKENNLWRAKPLGAAQRPLSMVDGHQNINQFPPGGSVLGDQPNTIVWEMIQPHDGYCSRQAFVRTR